MNTGISFATRYRAGVSWGFDLLLSQMGSHREHAGLAILSSVLPFLGFTPVPARKRLGKGEECGRALFLNEREREGGIPNIK